ncbi:MAG: hypothetical protein AAB074_03375 [Planctomycetota bacterium]
MRTGAGAACAVASALLYGAAAANWHGRHETLLHAATLTLFAACFLFIAAPAMSLLFWRFRAGARRPGPPIEAATVFRTPLRYARIESGALAGVEELRRDAVPAFPAACCCCGSTEDLSTSREWITPEKFRLDAGHSRVHLHKIRTYVFLRVPYCARCILHRQALARGPFLAALASAPLVAVADLLLRPGAVRAAEWEISGAAVFAGGALYAAFSWLSPAAPRALHAAGMVVATAVLALVHPPLAVPVPVAFALAALAPRLFGLTEAAGGCSHWPDGRAVSVGCMAEPERALEIACSRPEFAKSIEPPRGS